MSERDPIIDPNDEIHAVRSMKTVIRSILGGWDVPQKTREEAITAAQKLLKSEREDVRAKAVDLLQRCDQMRLKAAESIDKMERLDAGQPTENTGKIEIVYTDKPHAD